MGFLSAIRAWLEKINRLRAMYAVARRNPGDLAAITDTLKENELALLKYYTGHAITQWALVEERMILLATLLLDTTPEKAGLSFTP